MTPSELQAEIERLRHECLEWQAALHHAEIEARQCGFTGAIREPGPALLEIVAERDEARAQAARLAEALQPFAAVQKAWMEEGRQSQIRMDWLTSVCEALASTDATQWLEGQINKRLHSVQMSIALPAGLRKRRCFVSPTDPGLDERVCRKLGWEPHWQCEDCDHLNEMKDERCRAFLRVDSCGWPRERNEDDALHWLPVSTSWEWAGKALDRLGKARLWARISGPHRYADGTTLWGCSIYGTHASTSCTDRQAATAPLAIALAIDAALPEVKW